MGTPAILLCYSRNTPYSYEAHTPLSILALGTYLESQGVAIEYFDERLHPPSRFRDLLRGEPPAVGFSVIGGHQIASAARLSRAVRRLSPRSKIVWGGIEPTTLAHETLREEFVDYVVMGEGERPLQLLLSHLCRGTPPLASIPGLGHKGDGDITLNPPGIPLDINELPFVYQGKALDMLRLYNARSTVREMSGYEASRGCPFLCEFCYSPNFNKENTRTKSLEKIAGELASLRRLGVEEIDIYDDTLLGAQQRNFPRFFELLRENGIRWIGNLRINMLTEELVKKMEASGCKWIYFGIESNDDATLRKMKKGITAEQIYAGIHIMRKSRVSTVYSVILGLPIEGEESKIGRYLDFVREIHALHPSAEIQVQSYVPLPGTPLYPQAVRLGFRPPSRLLDWANHDHFTTVNPWLAKPTLTRKIYLTSFLAYRYKRHLSHFPIKLAAYPLHKLSLLRIRMRWFGLYFESCLYRAYLRLSKVWNAAYHGWRSFSTP